LAGLTAFEILDLPEKEARDDATKITAVLRWLELNPTWLMILDNVDDKDAVAEVAKLMPRLKGGHVVVTARASNFPAGVRKLEVSTLDEDAATQFLLDRTEADRAKSKDDAALARTLARELGGLALGLEQAGANIATDRIGFARYLKLWGESREKALAWADAMVTGSDRTLATTWATSVARLSPGSRRLLDRLAFLAPEPVPDSLLDVAVPGEAPDYDAYAARSGLYAYSLVSGVTAEEGGASGFMVHRLVQDFARRAMNDERRTQALREALEWVNAAFVGAPNDVSNGQSSIRSRRTRSLSRVWRTQRGSQSRRRCCSTSLEFCSTPRLTTPRPKRSSAGRWRSPRRATAPIILMWRSPSTISQNC
jgi:hypothetical protein